MKKLLLLCAIGAFVACKDGDKKEGNTDSATMATPPAATGDTTSSTTNIAPSATDAPAADSNAVAPVTEEPKKEEMKTEEEMKK